MGVLQLSTRERKRLELLSRVKEGVLKLVKAAELCGLSYRQTKRVWKRYRDQGDAGLMHRGRGRSSNRRIDDEFQKKVLARYQERYPDFGPTLASEYDRDSHIGQLDKGLDEAAAKGWTVVDMKDDWATIFPPEKN